MKTFFLFLALLCVSAATLHAQLDDTDPQYRALCREAIAKPFTPPPVDPALKPDCDSTIAYFGIGHPVDYPAALACAYAEYAHPAITFSPFRGAGILSMIYANGQGTAPNLDLATRFTCENFAAPSEIEARLDILTAKEQEQAPDTQSMQTFDLCATASSTNTRDWCTSIEARQSEAERQQDIANFRATLPPTSILPFEALLLAEQDFENARISNELDLTGATPTFAGFHIAEKNFAEANAFDAPEVPAAHVVLISASAPTPAPTASAPIRLASQLEEQNNLGDRFVGDLKLLTSPAFSEKTSIRNADKNLETTLKLAHTAAPKHLKDTTINYKGIEETQRLWTNLRSSWITFIASTNPSRNLAEQAFAYITLERSRQLNELVDTARER